jgi:hypothetical protein
MMSTAATYVFIHGIVPDEIDSGHTPALSHPSDLVRRLEAYRALRTS